MTITVTEKTAKSGMLGKLNEYIGHFKYIFGESKKLFSDISKLNPEERTQVEKSIENFLKDMNRTITSAENFSKHSNLDRYEEHIEKTIVVAKLVFKKRAIEISDMISPKPTNQEQIDAIRKELINRGNPYRPQFSQIYAGKKFSDTRNVYTSDSFIVGKSVEEIGQSIKENPSIRELINIGVFYHDGAWISCNNRSLAAAAFSGVEPRIEIVFGTDEFKRYYDLKKANKDDLFSLKLEVPKGSSPLTVTVPEKWTELKAVRVSGMSIFRHDDTVPTKEPFRMPEEHYKDQTSIGGGVTPAAAAAA
jgi:hypothetical protein